MLIVKQKRKVTGFKVVFVFFVSYAPRLMVGIEPMKIGVHKQFFIAI
jgi:hypothetical protein